ncbi:MAG: phosphoenolpyruvate synthase [Rhizobacter sp.]|nr:phosphoenolpyruvate synthase [Bacteriovorax sp.]
MSIYTFDKITRDLNFLGGKGFTLGLMKNAGFNVPDGMVLTTRPACPLGWNEIIQWWKDHGAEKLAIRSSAIGEDSSEQSFAGQNSTYLNVQNEDDLKKAVENCFDSINKHSSQLYRQHFLKEEKNHPLMNVVVQIMVDPFVSGVFFSIDPRNNEKGWIVEAIEGLGEDLVSGKKTPWHFEENSVNETKLFDLSNLVKTGNEIRDFFGVEIDMEWAIDKKGQLKILQARPITALSGKSEEKRLIENELSRLQNNYPEDTIWDGGTFAEWSGPPSELTFSIWKEAFSKQHSFSKALNKIGYLGINQELPNEGHSLLERIFNRGYVNITMLAPLYFGPIPYRLEFKKNAELKFDFKKMTFKTFALTPFTIFRMLKVGLDLSTRRSEWFRECQKELVDFSDKSFRIKDINYYKSFSEERLFEHFKIEVENFYDETLVWPLVLITLIESTSQNLKALLKSVLSPEAIDQKLNEWLSIGLHTVTMDLNNDYKAASADEEKRSSFLQKYGHRGPGELELSHPRWIELGKDAFLDSKNAIHSSEKKSVINVAEQIAALNTYKKQVIEKEWLLLKEMLELREKWKMQLLSPYSHIRFMALEIARRYHAGEYIFWLSYQEILDRDFDIIKAEKRKHNCEMSKAIYLPAILELSKLDSVLNNKIESNSKNFSGLPLSPGMVFGEVRVIIDPENANTENWPENTVLVAESTDPGWTGLFIKSRAVIVEKGGVLSHCAIVAREMNLPAVSGIKQCHLRFKDGDKIWVDGNNGRITLA